MKIKKIRTRTRLFCKHVWCMTCVDKSPAKIKRADKMIPARRAHYDLAGDKCTIDPRVIGICDDCLAKKSNFHKNNAQDVDISNPHLIYGGLNSSELI